MPLRSRRIPILVTVRPSFTHAVMRCSSARSVRHASPWPSMRWGRTRSHTWPISSSVSCSSPAQRSTPSSTAAEM